MNKAGVPCGPIYNIDQVFADPQVKHLGIAQSTPKKDGAPLHLVGQPVTLSRTHEQDGCSGRRRSASTPTRCWANSDSRPTRSRRCARPRRYDRCRQRR